MIGFREQRTRPNYRDVLDMKCTIGKTGDSSVSGRPHLAFHSKVTFSVCGTTQTCLGLFLYTFDLLMMVNIWTLALVCLNGILY